MKCAHRPTTTCIRDKDGNILIETVEFPECIENDCSDYYYSEKYKTKHCRLAISAKGKGIK